MSKSLLLISIFVIGFSFALPLYATESCAVVLSDQTGDFKKISVPLLKSPTTQATLKDFEYTHGFYCRGGQALDGLLKFKDSSNEDWVIKVDVESLKNKQVVATLNYSRAGKKQGPQLDLRYAGSPCDLIQQEYPFSLVGLETKDGKWFSASLRCQPK